VKVTGKHALYILVSHWRSLVGMVTNLPSFITLGEIVQSLERHVTKLFTEDEGGLIKAAREGLLLQKTHRRL
jgi:hypothetical protein